MEVKKQLIGRTMVEAGAWTQNRADLCYQEKWQTRALFLIGSILSLTGWILFFLQKRR